MFKKEREVIINKDDDEKSIRVKKKYARIMLFILFAPVVLCTIYTINYFVVNMFAQILMNDASAYGLGMITVLLTVFQAIGIVVSVICYQEEKPKSKQ